jgi:hypothetical protein
MTLPLPSALTYGRVTHRVLAGVGDTAADPDTMPEGALIPGLKATFKPSADQIDVPAEKVTVFASPIVCTYDDQGRLAHGDNPWVDLISTDSGDFEEPWTWQVTISGNTIAQRTFSFLLPAGGEVDLVSVMPVATSKGVAITRGPGVPEGGTTGQALVKASSDDLDTVWADVEATGGGTSEPLTIPVYATEQDALDALAAGDITDGMLVAVEAA